MSSVSFLPNALVNLFRPIYDRLATIESKLGIAQPKTSDFRKNLLEVDLIHGRLDASDPKAIAKFVDELEIYQQVDSDSPNFEIYLRNRGINPELFQRRISIPALAEIKRRAIENKFDGKQFKDSWDYASKLMYLASIGEKFNSEKATELGELISKKIPDLKKFIKAFFNKVIASDDQQLKEFFQGEHKVFLKRFYEDIPSLSVKIALDLIRENKSQNNFALERMQKIFSIFLDTQFNPVNSTGQEYLATIKINDLLGKSEDFAYAELAMQLAAFQEIANENENNCQHTGFTKFIKDSSSSLILQNALKGDSLARLIDYLLTRTLSNSLNANIKNPERSEAGVLHESLPLFINFMHILASDKPITNFAVIEDGIELLQKTDDSAVGSLDKLANSIIAQKAPSRTLSEQQLISILTKLSYECIERKSISFEEENSTTTTLLPQQKQTCTTIPGLKTNEEALIRLVKFVLNYKRSLNQKAENN